MQLRFGQSALRAEISLDPDILHPVDGTCFTVNLQFLLIALCVLHQPNVHSLNNSPTFSLRQIHNPAKMAVIATIACLHTGPQRAWMEPPAMSGEFSSESLNIKPPPPSP
jgi:hypothetical protein